MLNHKYSSDRGLSNQRFIQRFRMRRLASEIKISFDLLESFLILLDEFSEVLLAVCYHLDSEIEEKLIV